MIQQLVPRGGSITSVFSGVDPTTVNTAEPLRLFLIQAGIIIVFSRILAFLLAKIKQPAVIAEVIGGILLGPTVFGRIPGFTAHIFPPASLPFLNLVANLGLLFFLFIIGLEVDTRIIRKCAFSATVISITGLVVPFGFGAAISYGIYERFIETDRVSFGHFLLFTGVAMAITALPVLARIVLDLNLMQTTVGNIVLAAGVANDVVGWILLALAIALVNASSGLNALYIFLVVIAWTLVLFFVVKPAIYWMARRDGSLANGPSRQMIFIILLIVLASGFLTDVIGVQAIFGGFLVGLIIPHENGFAVALTEKIEDVVTVVFLPLFFTLSGLQTNLATLNSGEAWGYTIAICIVAFASKFLGCAIPAKLSGFNLRESAAVGTLMSCKGLVELIVLNVGLNARILNTRVFSMFVVMAVVTTVITTPLTQLAYPPHHRKFVEEKEGDDEREDQDDQDEKSGPGKLAETQMRGQLSSKRLLVVLDHFDHLSGLLSFLQLLKPSSTPFEAVARADVSSLRLRRKEASSGDSSAEGDVSETQEAWPTSPTARMAFPTKLDAVRIMELTERTSAVMRVAETDDTLRSDPLTSVFSTFAGLNRLPVKATMNVAHFDNFSAVIVKRAKDALSDLILLPWTLPVTNAAASSAAQSAFLNPMEGFFGTNNDVSRFQQAAFVRKVIQNSPCDVGLLLNRKEGKSDNGAPNGLYPHIIFGFMGGPDDRCALSLALRMCKANDEIRVSLYRFRKVEGGEDLRSPQNTFHHVDSLRRPTGMEGMADTMYPHSASFTPLQAQLEDDLALHEVQEQLASDASLSARFCIQEVETPTPLHDLISLIDKTSLLSLVILGRNRRLPSITHRAELRKILSPDAGHIEKEDKVMNSETCTVVGEAGMAVGKASVTRASILIVASALAPARTLTTTMSGGNA